MIIVLLLVFSFFGGKEEEEDEEEEEYPEGEFDAFAGGYPVPPMPGQELPELAGVLSATPEPDATETAGAGTEPDSPLTEAVEDDKTKGADS